MKTHKKYKRFFKEKELSVSDAKIIFGITEIPNEDDLKVLYRDLSKKYHPDLGGDIEKMQDINNAYEVLKKNTGIKSSKIDWNEINKKWTERNKREFKNMERIFKTSFNIDKLLKYLQQFINEPLQYSIDYLKESQVREWTSSFFNYKVTVEIFNMERTTVFFLNYWLSYNFNDSGGLSYDNVNETDILYKVDVLANIYHNKRKEKLSKRDYRWNVGSKTITDYENIFPKVKLVKIFSGKSKKPFKKSDFLLGLERELNYNSDGNNYFIYILGKQTYFNLYRTVFMKTPMYTVGALQGWKQRGKPIPNDYIVNIGENEEDLSKFILTVKEIRKQVSKLNEETDYDKIYNVVSNAFKTMFPKRY